MNGPYQFHFTQPEWLWALLALAMVVWLGFKNLAALSPTRRWTAIIMRCLVLSLLIALLARPQLVRQNPDLCVLAVVDRSQSVPAPLLQQSVTYLNQALTHAGEKDRLAVIDIAELADIAKLPSRDMGILERNTTLTGDQSKLADGVQMALALAPPDMAARILVVSDGNQTTGDLKEVARIAAANGIPIDTLPLQYTYEREVIFKQLASPSQARTGQTISLRMVLSSTAETTGTLRLNMDGRPVDLDPESPDIAVKVELKPGTNVKTVSVPMSGGGLHEFEAVFIPDDPTTDRIDRNNRASAMTYIAGPGLVLVVDAEGRTAPLFQQMLQEAHIDSQSCQAADFPDNMAKLMNIDAVILIDMDCSSLTFQQQQMLCRYVTDLGGGLIMIGGPHAFGAGGWIGSPVAEILPVDPDPPQKKQLPKGALVLIMHACEMPQGNFWGKTVAKSAVKALSRLDLAGILSYGWQKGDTDWVYPLGPLDDKQAILSAIDAMQMGDMPDLGAHVQKAYDALKGCDAAQKHVIIISDGDPAPPSDALLAQVKQAGITCTGVAVFPHSPADIQSLMRIAQATGGRFHNVKDPQALPEIFIKEAQVVHRQLIVEESFVPQMVYSLSEVTRGVDVPLPGLDGFVITGPKGGLNQVVLASHQGDPILATGQAGVGRCVAFTSSADSRWASKWLSWPGRSRFWEQVVRWAARSAQSTDFEMNADVQGRTATVSIETADPDGKFIPLAQLEGQVIAPDMAASPLELEQIGPGRFRGRFQAMAPGNYLIHLRYRKTDDAGVKFTQTTVTVPFAPEFRDLRDNAPLLKEISEITGGRILPSDPDQADVFHREGVKFPQTQLPLNKTVMLIWLGLFLLDVAVRRIVLNPAAMARKALSWLRVSRRERQSEQTLQRLQAARDKARIHYTQRPDAARRYDAGEKYQGDLPVAASSESLQEPRFEPPTPSEKPKTAQTPFMDQPAHIQRLLDAKRQRKEPPGRGGSETP
jgi:uncharacterized membrane protein